MTNAWNDHYNCRKPRLKIVVLKAKFKINRWFIYQKYTGNPSDNPCILTSRRKNVPLISLRNEEYSELLQPKPLLCQNLGKKEQPKHGSKHNEENLLSNRIPLNQISGPKIDYKKTAIKARQTNFFEIYQDEQIRNNTEMEKTIRAKQINKFNSSLFDSTEREYLLNINAYLDQADHASSINRSGKNKQSMEFPFFINPESRGNIESLKNNGNSCSLHQEPNGSNLFDPSSESLPTVIFKSSKAGIINWDYSKGERDNESSIYLKMKITDEMGNEEITNREKINFNKAHSYTEKYTKENPGEMLGNNYLSERAKSYRIFHASKFKRLKMAVSVKTRSEIERKTNPQKHKRFRNLHPRIKSRVGNTGANSGAANISLLFQQLKSKSKRIIHGKF